MKTSTHIYRNGGKLTDIYDGQEYLKLRQNGNFLDSKNALSYSFFTDGVKLYHSSGVSMWPILIRLNELPIKECSQFVMLAGLWVGESEPKAHVLPQTFVEQAKKLATIGIFHLMEMRKHCDSYLLAVLLIPLHAH